MVPTIASVSSGSPGTTDIPDVDDIYIQLEDDTSLSDAKEPLSSTDSQLCSSSVNMITFADDREGRIQLEDTPSNLLSFIETLPSKADIPHSSNSKSDATHIQLEEGISSNHAGGNVPSTSSYSSGGLGNMNISDVATIDAITLEDNIPSSNPKETMPSYVHLLSYVSTSSSSDINSIDISDVAAVDAQLEDNVTASNAKEIPPYASSISVGDLEIMDIPEEPSTKIQLEDNSRSSHPKVRRTLLSKYCCNMI